MLCREKRLPIDERLDALRACIVRGQDEDAMEHLFALLRGLRVKDMPLTHLTQVGKQLHSEWAVGGE